MKLKKTNEKRNCTLNSQWVQEDGIKRMTWQCCKPGALAFTWEKQTERWYGETNGMSIFPEGAVETDEVKILWDVNIQCDHIIKASWPDINVVNKDDRNYIIIDIAVPCESRVSENEKERVK